MANTATETSTTKPRQSNFELLRIVTMLMVMITHAAFLTSGFPDRADFEADPFGTVSLCAFQGFGVACVNIFVMISGWFGIKPSLKGFCNFLFQSFFYMWGIYLVLLLIGEWSIDVDRIRRSFGINSGYWFVGSYALLYILSPVLNTFVKHATRRQMELFLLAFFAFEILYGWLLKDSTILGGYSTISFIGLYILARYLRIYRSDLSRYGGRIVLWSTAIEILMICFLLYTGIPIHPTAYVAVPVIICASGWILWCNTWKVPQSRIINFVAASAFAVYLIHVEPPYFLRATHSFYDNLDGPAYVLACAVLLVVTYLIGIILDQPRKWLWGLIARRFFPSQKTTLSE